MVQNSRTAVFGPNFFHPSFSLLASFTFFIMYLLQLQCTSGLHNIWLFWCNIYNKKIYGPILFLHTVCLLAVLWCISFYQELKLKESYVKLRMLRKLTTEFKNMNKVSFPFKLAFSLMLLMNWRTRVLFGRFQLNVIYISFVLKCLYTF